LTSATARTSIHKQRDRVTSAGIRDLIADDLITPQNAALMVIDWARLDTVEEVVQIVLTERLLQQ
jgi:hypothetical protein